MTRAALAVLVVLAAAPAALAQEAPAQDPPGLAQRYDVAFDALVRGDLDAAITGFDAVARETADPERRSAATELARLARALKRRVGAAGPGAAPVAPPADPHNPMGDPTGEVDSSDRSGRVEFVTMTTLTATYSGVVLLFVLDVDDFRVGSLLVTGTTAAGLLGSYYATKNRRITTGMADAYSTGITLGALNGALLAVPLGLDNEDDALSFVLGTTAVAGAGALYLGDRVRPTRAQATLTMTLSVAGLATAGWGLIIADPDEVDDDTVLLLLVGGLDAGAIAGIIAAPRLDWSSSRARLVSLSTFLGALGGVALGAILVGDPGDGDGNDQGRLLAGTTLGGMWAGFGLGAYLTRGMTPDPRFSDGPKQRDAFLMPTVVDGKPALGFAGYF